MNKITNSNYFKVLTITIMSTSILLLFSIFHFQVQPATAQNKDNSTRIIPPLTAAQLQQLSANGTSFDGFIKHRIVEMNAAKIPINYTVLDASNILNSSNILKSQTLCTSPLGRDFAQTPCDFIMATFYEICQAIPDRLYICATPSINSYIKDRNLVDEQTDKLAWQFFLLAKEIMPNS